MPDVTVLCGAAGSGKSRWMRQRYADAVVRHGSRRVVLLMPTEPQCAQARRLILLETDLRGLWQPHIYTIDALAQRLLNEHDPFRTELPSVTQRILLRQIVERLAQQDAFTFFRSVYAFPGFLDMLQGFLRRTKQQGLSPEQWLQTAAASSLLEAQRRELYLIYDAYQNLLHHHNVSDADERLMHARALLLSGHAAPFDDLKVLLLDGFNHLSPVEWDVVECLVQRAEETCVTLTDELDSPRPTLFQQARALRQEWEKRFPIKALSCPLLVTSDQSGLAHLQRTLFAEGREDKSLSENSPLPNTEERGEAQNKPSADDSVQLIEAAGQFREVEEIAREVKRLLLAGEAAPEDIALLFRHLPDYAPLVQEVFAAFGVPVHLSHRETPLRSPAVQTVLSLLRIVADDFRREDVVQFLKSNYVGWSWEGEAPAEPILPTGSAGASPSRQFTPDDLDRVARRARITSGKDNWQRRLQTHERQLQARLEKWERGELAEEFEENGEHLAQELEQTRRAREYVEAFFQRLAPLSRAQTRAQIVAAIRQLMDAFGITERLALDIHSDGAQIAADLNFSGEDLHAFEQLQRALEDMRFTETFLNESEKAIALSAFLGELQTALRLTTPPPSNASAGCVRALNVTDAAGLTFPYVFIAGLVEKEFPRPQSVNLLSPEEPTSAEDFLFYTAVTRATKRLYLCYPITDAEGRAVLTSYYVDAVRRCFATDLTVCARVQLSAVVPELHRVCSQRELLDAAVPYVIPHVQHAICRLLPADLLTFVRHAAAVETHRHSTEPFNHFDGVLSDPAVHEDLAKRFHARYRFSANQFNTFGQCPMRFYFKYVLNLEPLEEPTDTMQHRERGQMVHEILRRFFTQLSQVTGSTVVTAENMDVARAVMEEVIERHFTEQAQRGLVGDERLWEVEKQNCQRDLALWLAHESHLTAAGHVPLRFEATYGMHAGEEPLCIGSGEEQVCVQGKIDRIDRLPPDEDGTPRYAVFDYKSSGNQRWQAALEGTDFQLPLYALAAQHIVLRDEPARCAEWAYYKVRRPIARNACVAAEGKKAQMAECLQATLAHLPRYAARMRGGQFPAA
ncbi:MAG: exodeoxyribonuclease V subunit gamma, partial [Abditibacteriales bacterium]|nr:exodeoxyribonuclease V subunit gamma [Abditibacteriales bacterium]MDW8365414.1 PD-(D/E)XK nuclease family protein [Abditibacteriales bacterium]